MTFPRWFIEMIKDNLYFYLLTSKFTIITTALLLYLFCVFALLHRLVSYYCEIPKGRDFSLLCSLQYLQGLEQSLAYKRWLINIETFWIKCYILLVRKITFNDWFTGILELVAVWDGKNTICHREIK